MERRITQALAIVFAGFSALSGAVSAQELAATATTATDAVPLSVVERWRLDPTTVFDSNEIVIEDLHFIARPVVVFADSPADPQYAEQLELLLSRVEELVIRDVIIITDTDPAARSPLRQELRPRGFALVLVGKDGRVALRKPAPWDVRELTRSIDKMPLRQQEIRERTE
ncbi:MAG: DUF4174 domain-containing protein [Flavimaricola sp.]|nr:DUF4174 domain-containing protein [Flavimaricola sp.]